jgi:hypothetical protein
MDLFEAYDKLPKEVKTILDSFSEEGCAYKECERLLAELKPLGYIFDYGLCGTPYDLKKI